MRKSFALLLTLASLFALSGCAKGPKVKDPELFRTKTGVIGVFRHTAFYCNEENPQYMTLGDSLVEVKPGWSEEQDNLFVTEQKPGVALLRSYEYSCGEDKHRFVLDSGKAGATGVVVPSDGFCKIVISFKEGDKLFSQNDNLLMENFDKNSVAYGFHKIPYCEIVNHVGKKVVQIDKDSVLQAQYQAAIADAAEALESEIRPLVKITDDSEMITWNNEKDHVMMVVFHDSPDLYSEGENLLLSQEIWVVSEKELHSWYLKNKDGVEDWSLRFKQLLGFAPDSKKTHFSALWVKPKDLLRPAYSTDITSESMGTNFDDNFEDYSDDKEFKASYKHWFEKNRSRSIQKRGGNPWTRLGYTYDWGSVGDKYGLSEFLIFKDSEVKVVFTKNIKTFLNWLDAKK